MSRKCSSKTSCDQSSKPVTLSAEGEFKDTAAKRLRSSGGSPGLVMNSSRCSRDSSVRCVWLPGELVPFVNLLFTSACVNSITRCYHVKGVLRTLVLGEAEGE